MDNTSLPADFDGVFRFTNPTEEDYTDKWNGKSYTFPAMTTSPMLIVDASPIEVQHIRKKFAKGLAEREYFKSDKYLTLQKSEKNPDGSARFNSFQQAGQYSDNDLQEWIQLCLKPLSVSQAIITESKEEPLEKKLTLNKRGRPVTRVVDDGDSLVGQAQAATGEL